MNNNNIRTNICPINNCGKKCKNTTCYVHSGKKIAYIQQWQLDNPDKQREYNQTMINKRRNNTNITVQ